MIFTKHFKISLLAFSTFCSTLSKANDTQIEETEQISHHDSSSSNQEFSKAQKAGFIAGILAILSMGGTGGIALLYPEEVKEHAKKFKEFAREQKNNLRDYIFPQKNIVQVELDSALSEETIAKTGKLLADLISTSMFTYEYTNELVPLTIDLEYKIGQQNIKVLPKWLVEIIIQSGFKIKTEDFINQPIFDNFEAEHKEAIENIYRSLRSQYGYKEHRNALVKAVPEYFSDR